MKPRKSRNTYSIYIGTPSMGRVAVASSMKQARLIGKFYDDRGIPFRIVPSKQKVVVV